MRISPLLPAMPVFLLLVSGQAWAHAMLDHAEPRVGNKVASPPREVTLTFTEQLEPAFSSVTVIGPSGQRIDAGKARVNGNKMSVPLKGAGAGTYHVNWHVLSVDTHTTDGSFTFQVGP